MSTSEWKNEDKAMFKCKIADSNIFSAHHSLKPGSSLHSARHSTSNISAAGINSSEDDGDDDDGGEDDDDDVHTNGTQSSASRNEAKSRPDALNRKSKKY
jgi:hypothetical protein